MKDKKETSDDYTEIRVMPNSKVIEKLYKLKNPIKGYDRVFVSVKERGIDGLAASYFIHGTDDDYHIERELAWDCGDKEYKHDEVLINLINNPNK